MLSRNEAEYLKIIYQITDAESSARTLDIAKKLGVKPPSVTEMLQKLSRQGLLEYKPYYCAKLTSEGVQNAKKLIRKHSIFQTFMHVVVGTPDEQAHQQACEVGHILSDEAEQTLCKMMGKPPVCRDNGEPIPDCEMECNECLKDGVRPLTELDENSSAVISHISTSDKVHINRLVSMGLLPDRHIKLLEVAPMGGPLIVDIGDSVVAISRDFAKDIFIEEV